MFKKVFSKLRKSNRQPSTETLIDYFHSSEEDLINSQATQTQGVEDRTIEYVTTDSPNFEFRIKVNAETCLPKLKFVRLNPEATPLHKIPENAGFDLTSVYNYVIPAKGNGVVLTGLAVEIPIHTYGRIAPRSGLALIHELDIGAGVIDSGYRGEIGVVVFNHGDTDYSVKKGDRIAQLLIIKLENIEVEEVKLLNPSNRGLKGFGSSGY